MPKRQSHARIQAQITGKAKQIGAIEAHVRNVTAITRRIHKAVERIREVKQDLKRMQDQLRIDRRELRAVLQRDSTITEDSPILDRAGKADAIDAANHHREK